MRIIKIIVVTFFLGGLALFLMIMAFPKPDHFATQAATPAPISKVAPTPEVASAPEQQPAESEYQQTQDKLVSQLYFVHDNGGSEADMCAVVLEIRANAQANGDATTYKYWGGANVQEVLFERDARRLGLDIANFRHWTRAESKKMDPYVEQDNVVCP